MWPAGAGIANAEADIEKNSDQSAQPAQLGFPTLCKEEKMIRLLSERPCDYSVGSQIPEGGGD